MSTKLITLTQAQELTNAALQKVKDKNYAVSATTLAGYGIEDAYTKTEVDSLIGATYRPAGTIAGSALISTLLVEGNVGKVYNISSELAITAENEDLFLNLSAGDKVKAGDDVGVVEATVNDETVYLFNDFAGFIDLSAVTYTGGDGIAVSNANVISVDVDSTDANGLGITDGKLKLDTVVASASGVGGSNGAMTAAQAEKLADLENTTAGNGIDITSHVASVKIDSSNARGLSATVDGLGLALATPDTYTEGSKTADGTAGAMSSADKYKLDNADVTAYEAGNGIAVANHTISAVVDPSSANGLSVGANGLAMATVTASTNGSGGSNGAMIATDKEKLDNADVEAYTAGNGINVNNHVVSAVVDSMNARGLSVGNDGIALALATADTWGGVTATGTYAAGTVYYTTAACTTVVDTTDFVVGETDVSSYYVKAKTADGTAGALSSADKYKLDDLGVASTSDISSVIAGLISL